MHTQHQESNSVDRIPNADEWATQQWDPCEFGDRRLNRRAVAMGTQIAAHPEASLPEQMQDPSALDAAYRLLNNNHVTMEDLIAPHVAQTLTQAGHQPVVLWVEDTTELDFTAHRSKKGLGPIGDGRGRGLLLHTTLGLVPDTGALLGVGQAQVVLREAATKPRPKWTRSPEGRVWEVSAQRIGSPPPGVTWVHVSDRGSDIFEYMAACVSRGKAFILRVQYNRVLTWDDAAPQASDEEARKILDYARSLPPQAQSDYTVTVQATPKQPARSAHVVLQWAPITLSAPSQAPPEVREQPPLALWIVRAWEPEPPAGVEALEWILLTPLPGVTLADARCRVAWYGYRWVCEDYHQCLKTGCRSEASQLDEAADIQRLLGFHLPVAVHLLQLRHAARQTPAIPACQLVEPLMVAVLARRMHQDEQTMTIGDFWRGVTRLGGYQGRKHDGPAGWRTVWRGWRYLSDLTDGARLFAPPDSS